MQAQYREAAGLFQFSIQYFR